MIKNTLGAALATMALVLVSGCGGSKAASPDAAPAAAGDNLVVPDRAGKFLEATQVYGPLVVTETPAEGVDATADTKPWSSYWYPLTDDILVKGSDRNGGRSTLEKYDLFSSKIWSKNSSSVSNEISSGLYIDSNQPGWEGRCNAWAMASVMEPEPVLPVAGVEIPGLSGTKFYTRDVKALVVKSYELIEEKSVRRFGQRFDGNPGDDRDDIYPDQFQRVLVSELFEKHRPILMDSDAGSQVWNTPIWYANLIMTRDARDAHIMHVIAEGRSVDSTSDAITPDTVGTYNVVFRYTYDLYGLPQANGSLLVKYGKWTGDSVLTHPDFVTALPPKGTKIKHANMNKQLDQAVVDDLLTRTGANRH
jgi:hypothetical protein